MNSCPKEKAMEKKMRANRDGSTSLITYQKG